jgi:predicted 3-demethylubiquinone-9 3-methyltransferase (glyoxalase superfamily)
MNNFEPCLWFDKEALEAAEYYVSIFPNSSIKNITYFSE